MYMRIICKKCGINAIAKRKSKAFCSQKCADSFRYKPRPKKGKFIKCAYCEKDVWTRPSRFNKYKLRFCCKEHNIKYLKNNSFKMHCIICGKIFYCQPCQVRLRGRKTCSIKCRSKLRSSMAIKNRIKNGFTKHQIDRCIRYSKQSDDWRGLIFKRDNYTCQECGERGAYLEAHHIKPFAYFPELRFDLQNGITLCYKCHKKTKVSYKELRQKYGENTTTETKRKMC